MLTVPLPSPCRYILAFLCACSFVIQARAQSTEADVKSRLNDKPLYLRGCWRDDHLRFDSTGHLLGTSGPVTFTLCGFRLKSAHLKQDGLILEGWRVGLELANGKQKRVILQVGDPGSPSDESMRLEIKASPNGDYGPALDAIFIEGLQALVPSLPFYWQAYAQKNFLPATKADTAPATPAASATPPSVPQTSVPQKAQPFRNGVKPPKLLGSAEPAFNNSARALKYSGTTLINLWIETDGTVSHLSIVRALGIGLDESALSAVQHYKFAPATENGNPVQVELRVEVNFQIY